MSDQKDGHIQVRATKDGKLYVNVLDLFKQKKVQDLIRRMAESEVLKEARHIKSPMK